MKLAITISALVVSCSPALPSPQQQADVGAYETEQLACVAAYPTRQLIDACRADVKIRFGRVDGGTDGAR